MLCFLCWPRQFQLSIGSLHSGRFTVLPKGPQGLAEPETMNNINMTLLVDAFVFSGMYIDVTVNDIQIKAQLLNEQNQKIPNFEMLAITGPLVFTRGTNNSFTGPFMGIYNVTGQTVTNDPVLAHLVSRCTTGIPLKIEYSIQVYSTPLEFFKVVPVKTGTLTTACPSEAVTAMQALVRLQSNTNQMMGLSSSIPATSQTQSLPSGSTPAGSGQIQVK